MKTLELVAITNFILAAALIFFAGMLFGNMSGIHSPYSSWAAAMVSLGISAFMGGIDHGFLEPKGNTLSRIIAQRATWIFVAFTAFFTGLTVLRLFFPGLESLKGYTLLIAYLLLFIIIIIYKGRFAFVIIAYAPVMLLFLILNIKTLHTGPGSAAMTTGLILAFAGSALQMMRFHQNRLFNHNCWYHIIGTAAAVFLYIGGTGLPQ